MSKRGVYFTGVDALSRKLKENASMKDVKTIVKVNSEELERTMREKAQFKGHYHNGRFVSPTGTTRRSIDRKMSRNGMQGKVGPKTEYSPYLEYGTRFMSAQPFVGPSFRKQSVIFIKDLARLFE